MDINVLFRKMAAEGIPSIHVVADAIITIGDEMKTHGYWVKKTPRLDLEVIVRDGLIKYFDHLDSSYTSGITLNQEPTPIEKSIGELTPKNISKFLRELPEGTKIYVDTSSTLSDYDVYIKGVKEWCYDKSYSESSEYWEDQTLVFLPAGIREAVAKKLSLDVTNLFHQAFDLAVAKLEKDAQNELYRYSK